MPNLLFSVSLVLFSFFLLHSIALSSFIDDFFIDLIVHTLYFKLFAWYSHNFTTVKFLPQLWQTEAAIPTEQQLVIFCVFIALCSSHKSSTFEFNSLISGKYTIIHIVKVPCHSSFYYFICLFLRNTNHIYYFICLYFRNSNHIPVTYRRHLKYVR